MAKTPTKFYVYRILGEKGETVYIGKGTGRRLHNQKRKFRCDGEIIAEFSTDKAAYRHERRLIALHNPPLNKHAGGTGGDAGGGSNGNLWRGLARILRTLSEGALTPEAKASLVSVVSAVVQKRAPTEVAERLKPYGVEVSFSHG